MKFKKLAIMATAAVMATSTAAPAVAQTTVQASTFADDLHTVAGDIRARNAAAAGKVIAGLASAAVAGAVFAQKAHQIDKHVQNRLTFHLKRKKVYLILKNGKRAGKKYYLLRNRGKSVLSWPVPKRKYKIHGKKCYKVGKTRSGKTVYLPVKYTAYTHMVD